MSAKIRIVHVINSLEYGGAEAMLCNLLLRADRDRFEPSVVCLIDDLTVAGPIQRAGIPITSIGMRPGVPDPLGLLRLASHLRRARPAVVQTWMDHSNLVGGTAARMAACPNVVWGIHHSNHVRGVAKRSTLMTVGACGLLSARLPSRIVCCSQHARDLYAQRGFARDKLALIPNGFDTQTFHPDPIARVEVRQELGLGPDVPLIGLVARYDPLKDHATFLRAAAMLARVRPDAHFLLCGANVTRANQTLASLIDSLGLTQRCRLLGPRHDMPRINAALDVATSSSISEAFPLALGEAMACGVPCVATDVGDSALIIGPAGRIVRSSNPQAMADAWSELLALEPGARASLSRLARARIRELFDLETITRRYEQLYENLVSARTRAKRRREPVYALMPQTACVN
jgi:glycosyltransferase involved in cell wall biosynthesis